MKFRLFIFGFICLLLFGHVAKSTHLDSLGLRKKSDGWFIVHQVRAGETLYSLSRRYRSTVDAIKKSNPAVKNGLSIDDTILIPYSDEDFILHFVLPGETLYAISKKFAVSVEELKNWNELESNSLEPGMELIVKECRVEFKDDLVQGENIVHHKVVEGDNLFNISQQYRVSVEELRSWNNLDNDEIGLGQVLNIYTNAYSVTSEQQSTSVEQVGITSNKTADEGPAVIINLPLMEERGLAELIMNSQETEKYLALHRTLPAGTVLIVRNEMNNQAVFVRVIGKLPDTGANEKVILKISQAAWKSINSVNPKLRVKVSYLNPE